MFRCQKCEVMEKELIYLREQNEKLTNKLLAVADVRAYTAVQFGNGQYRPEDYYGNDQDELIEYDDLGQKVIVKRATEPTS